MLRHVVMFKLDEAAPAGTMETILAGLARLRKLPMVSSYSFGTDLGVGTGTYDVVLVGEFADTDAWRAYMADPTHLEFVNTVIRPNVSARAAVQYEVT
jgi:hypothetical protein